jgi:hypothetical protein
MLSHNKMVSYRFILFSCSNIASWSLRISVNLSRTVTLIPREMRSARKGTTGEEAMARSGALSNKCKSAIELSQRCQIIFFKSARSDVKIRQNLPSRIGQIRQKSARNWDDFRPFFSLRVVFVAFLVRILPYFRSGQRGNIYLF